MAVNDAGRGGTFLRVYVDADTLHRLQLVADESGRTISELAEAAVAEAALAATRHRRIMQDT